MKLHFTKMHGLGNDFVVIDAIHQPIDLSANQIQAWSNRHLGIGFDQLLLVEKPRHPGTDFYYRIFNADGSEVAQCGNGVRCLARFVKEKGLTAKLNISVATATSRMELELQSDGQVAVNMGIPVFVPQQIPCSLPLQELPVYEISLQGKPLKLGIVGLGNPHAVIQVSDCGHAPVKKIGSLLSKHPLFPEGVNVGFMQIISPDHIRLRVYERGVGETLACGSGACAAMAIGAIGGLLASEVQVDLAGGSLYIHWRGHEQPLWMIGPAVKVFDGTVDMV